MATKGEARFMSGWRLGMAGLASENCTFSPSPTTLDDFEILRGEAQLSRYPFLKSGGALTNTTDAAFLPAFHGRALPGGVITLDTYQTLKGDLLESLDALLPLDGVYLDLHGAMKVEGLPDAEADLAASVRMLIGEPCLISASMDLHGNISRELVETVDLFTAYRTAPHIDCEETREKACRLLLDALRNDWEPRRAFVPIPVLLPGEMTSTLDEPGKSLYSNLTTFDDRPGILDVSLWVGYVWADQERSHAAVVVTGIAPEEELQAVAEEVAAMYWEAREAFRFNVPSGNLTECLDHAIADTMKPVIISDSGDNPTAGGVGDLPYALRSVASREIFRGGRKQALIAGIWDPAAVERCLGAGEMAEIELEIGTQSDRAHGSSLHTRGLVETLYDGDPVAGWQAVFRIGKGLQVVLTQRRKPFHERRDFEQLGLEPETVDVIVVKIGYLVSALEALASKAYLALTPGAVDQHITRVTYSKIQRPMFPFDRDFDWTPKAIVTGEIV